MTLKLLQFPPKPPPVEPDNALTDALSEDMTGVVILGWDKNENFYFNSSENVDNTEVLWLLETAKRRLFETVEAMADEE